MVILAEVMQTGGGGILAAVMQEEGGGQEKKKKKRKEAGQNKKGGQRGISSKQDETLARNAPTQPAKHTALLGARQVEGAGLLGEEIKEDTTSKGCHKHQRREGRARKARAGGVSQDQRGRKQHSAPA